MEYKEEEVLTAKRWEEARQKKRDEKPIPVPKVSAHGVWVDKIKSEKVKYIDNQSEYFKYLRSKEKYEKYDHYQNYLRDKVKYDEHKDEYNGCCVII